MTNLDASIGAANAVIDDARSLCSRAQGGCLQATYRYLELFVYTVQIAFNRADGDGQRDGNFPV